MKQSRPSLVNTKGTKYGKHNQPIIARLIPRIIIDDGCWDWLGTIDENGYGRFWYEGEWLYAHREVWRLIKGSIPDGDDVDHECHNEAAHAGLCTPMDECLHRRCTNLTHLATKPRRANLLASPFTEATVNSSRTHCPQGHEYNEENTRVKKDGGRQCKTCG